MVEESISTDVKSEKNESEDGDEKPNPTWGLVITKGGSKILSRYLGGPTFSCHDACKYGIKHVIETKPWNARQNMVSTRGKKTKIPDSLGMEQSRSSSKPSPNSKIGRPISPVVVEELGVSLMNEKAACKETNLPLSEETDVSMEHTGSDIKQDQPESSLSVQEILNTQTHRKIVESKSPPGSSSRMKSERGSKQRRTSLTGGKPPTSPLSSKHNVKKSSSISSQTRNDTRKGIIGKEVKDVQSNDSKIKSEKVVPGLQTVEGSKRRSFRRKAVDGSKIDGSNSGSENVLLRHQSLESKNVARRTYNNVIEETASQLAELRQSKVKALVGAFESVISLDHPAAKPTDQVSLTC